MKHEFGLLTTVVPLVPRQSGESPDVATVRELGVRAGELFDSITTPALATLRGDGRPRAAAP